MGRNILFLSVLCLLIFETTAVLMCTNQSSSSNDISLSLNYGTDVSGCNCSVKLTETGTICSKIKFDTAQFSSCKYRLVISYKSTNSIISCSNTNTVFFDINKTDEIKLYLESINSQYETMTFQMTITSSGDLIRLDCFSPTISTQKTTIAPPTTSTSNSTQTSPPVSTSTQESTSPTTTLTKTSPEVSSSSSSSVSTKESTPTLSPTPTTTLTPTQESMSTSTQVSTQPSTQESSSSSSSVSMTGSTLTLSPTPSTTLTPTPVTPTVTQISNKPTTGNDVNETKTEGVTNPGGDDIDIGIIGGAVGGGLLLIIVIIIIIIVCVVKKRRKEKHEKKDYNRPTVTGPQHDYTDIDLRAKVNNSSDNMVQKANSQVEIEIIENDLYVSSDDIMDPKSRDNNNTNQKTDANNGPAENSTYQDNDGPLYAAVNKKNKSFKSDQTDKSNGIAGYTDSDLEAKGNNSSSRQSDNTEQNTKSPVEIEMDPKSRDDNNTNKKTDAMDSKSRDDNNTNQKTDAMDPKSRDDNNTNQKTDAMDSKYTDANNCPAEMEIIENDLYVSSGEASNSRDNDGPLYSSVNKTPKSPISNQAGNSNGITGEDHDTLL